jgi:hypothetical protein
MPILSCGDIESNPRPVGPTTPSFTDFTLLAAEFAARADQTQLSKAVLNLRFRTRAFPDFWWTHVIQSTGLTLEKSEAEKLCGAYKLFSDCNLIYDNDCYG